MSSWSTRSDLYCPDCGFQGVEVCSQKLNEWRQTEYVTHCRLCGLLRHTQTIWPAPPSTTASGE